MILCPYTPAKLRPETRDLVLAVGGWLEDVSASMDAYWALVAGLWGRETLVIVEHDIVPTPLQVRRLARCPERWCAHPYLQARGIMPALGLAKFSAKLQRDHPDLLEEVGRLADDGLPARDWRRLDERIARALRARGVEMHVHESLVQHLHKE